MTDSTTADLLPSATPTSSPSTPTGRISINPPRTVGVDARFSENPVPAKPSASLGEVLEAAKDTSWVIRDMDTLDRLLKRKNENSPRVTEQHWKSLKNANQYDTDQLEAFRDLVDEGATEEEWEDLIEEFAITNHANQVIADQGWTGVGAQFGAALLDPTFLGATAGSVATGNVVVGSILAGQKLGRLGRIAKLAGEVAVADGSMMALRSQTNHDYSEQDMAIDLLATFAVVGGIEKLSALKAASASAALEKRQAEQYISRFEEQGERNVGAAQTKGDAGVLRWDDFGVMANSENAIVREFAEGALQDGVKGGSHSAAVLVQRLREHYVGRQNKAFYVLWKSHKPNVKGGVLKQAQALNQLSEQVWEAVVLGADHGPEVTKVAKEFAKVNKEMLEAAQEAGLNGFEDIIPFEGYLKQEWDIHGWRKAATGSDALNDDEFVELIYKGLNDVDDVPLEEQLDAAKQALRDHEYNHGIRKEAGDGEADAALAQLRKEVDDIQSYIDARKRLSMGFVRRMLNKSDGEQRPLNELLEDEDSLVKWLREDESFRTSSEAEIKAFVSKALRTKTKQDKKNVVDRAKRRIHINPAAEITKGGRTVRVADLMSRDAMGLQQSYIHEMTGNIAFAKRLGFKGPRDWEEFKQRAYAKEIELNHKDPKADKKADKVVEQLDEMKREIFGHNRYDLSGDWERVASVVMKYNFMTTMGKAAFSALSEFGRIMAENRVRNVLKVLPSLHKIIADSFRTVTKDSTLVKEVNSLNASIGDEHLLRYFNSFDEVGMREGRFTDGMLNKTELYAHRGTRFMAKASLLAPMDKALRLISFQSSVNSLYSHLLKGKKARLAFDEMGMNQDLRWRIKANMQQHGVETDFWGNVTKLNIEKWDRKAADEMMDALTANGARQVQKSIAGENTWITSHPWGRVFLQFRKFAIDSYVKHLRADIHSARNGQALRVMLSNMWAAVFAAAGYTARTHVGTLGMDEDDREAYLEERLAEPRLAANIAAYTPTVGPVVNAWNTGPGWLFPDVVVPVSRASGLANSDIGSNPTTATLSRARNLLHDVGDAEVENVIDRGRFLLPFQNTIWGDMLLNTGASAIR